MKALIRNPGEIVTEAMNMSGIDWNTGAPLTNAAWCGGPYILVNDYVPDDPADDFDPTPAQDLAADTIVIDGVTYTRTS